MTIKEKYENTYCFLMFGRCSRRMWKSDVCEAVKRRRNADVERSWVKKRASERFFPFGPRQEVYSKRPSWGATVLPSSVRPCSSQTLSSQVYHGLVEDSGEALPQTKVAVSLCRDDSRIAADLDWHLKARVEHKVNGNSAFFSAEREGDFCRNPEI